MYIRNLDIGNLESGLFRDLPILRQCEQIQNFLLPVRSVQFIPNHVELGYYL